MGVLESHGKVLDFFVSKRVGTLIYVYICIHIYKTIKYCQLLPLSYIDRPMVLCEI